MTIKIYEVGGAVRDYFCNVPNNDIDFAVEAPSYEDMKKYILDRGATIFIEHPDFVTIRAKWSPDGLSKQVACDFTLCRKDGEYLDNRHPSSVETGTIEEDLSRRDFTVNAIARDCITGKILDPFDGLKDIRNRLIKCVGDPNKRFEEDALRIMRALRFSICLGYEIDYPTELAMLYNFSLLKNISAERIKDELHKMFAYNSVTALKKLSLFNRNELSFIFNERTGIWLEPTMKGK